MTTTLEEMIINEFGETNWQEIPVCYQTKVISYIRNIVNMTNTENEEIIRVIICGIRNAFWDGQDDYYNLGSTC